MSDLPSRAEASYEDVAHADRDWPEYVGRLATIACAYIDGTLMTRQEFTDSLDRHAAAQAIYDTWDSVGKGALEITSIEAANLVVNAALGEDTDG